MLLIFILVSLRFYVASSLGLDVELWESFLSLTCVGGSNEWCVVCEYSFLLCFGFYSKLFESLNDFIVDVWIWIVGSLFGESLGVILF